jgi:hypothetical protein
MTHSNIRFLKHLTIYSRLYIADPLRIFPKYSRNPISADHSKYSKYSKYLKYFPQLSLVVIYPTNATNARLYSESG